MYKVLRKNFVYRWRRPKELPLIYKKRRSNPMIGTPLFLNNLNYTHTIENVNKIICTFLKTLKINSKKSSIVHGKPKTIGSFFDSVLSLFTPDIVRQVPRLQQIEAEIEEERKKQEKQGKNNNHK